MPFYAQLPILGANGRHYPSISDRLRAKIRVEGECWIWTDAPNSRRSDYGRFHALGIKQVAHRYVYQLLVGPVPKDLTLDHLCRRRPCVNPAHLEPVTIGENVRRGVKARRAAHVG